MPEMDLALLTIGCIYSAAVLTLAFALAFYRSPKTTASKHFITVLVPARNEAVHIRACLDALARQTYDQSLFEVIVINDRSTDATEKIALESKKIFSNFKVHSIAETPKGIAPKKHALNEGIKIARGEIVLCTDADCRPEEGWIQSMAESFTENVGMVVGYSPIEPRSALSLFQHFVALDSLALASIAAGSAFWGKPLTATGRSLAYRKSVFNEVGGFSKIAHFISGDDDLLLQLVHKTRWEIAYCIGNKSLVATDPPRSLSQFINQKIRQASKGRHYHRPMVLFLVIFYFFNVALISYAPWKIMNGSGLVSELVWGMKGLADLFFLLIGATRFHKWTYLIFYPIIEILHPIYVAVFGLWGQFGKFEWKNDASTNRKNNRGPEPTQ